MNLASWLGILGVLLSAATFMWVILKDGRNSTNREIREAVQAAKEMGEIEKKVAEMTVRINEHTEKLRDYKEVNRDLWNKIDELNDIVFKKKR